MKVIFLDIDGVMNSIASWDEGKQLGLKIDNSYFGPPKIAPIGAHYFAPWSVAALNRITGETGAKIVISSTWRESAIPWLRHWGVRGDIIDTTPRLENRTEGGIWIVKTRGAEIQSWLDRWKTRPGAQAVESFVILDDDGDMGHLWSFMVQTRFERGLTESEATRAIAVLRDEI